MELFTPDWKTSHMTDSNESNSQKDIETGVPQGSILGSLLVLVFFNDLVEEIHSSLRMLPCSISQLTATEHRCLEVRRRRKHNPVGFVYLFVGGGVVEYRCKR